MVTTVGRSEARPTGDRGNKRFAYSVLVEVGRVVVLISFVLVNVIYAYNVAARPTKRSAATSNVVST